MMRPSAGHDLAQSCPCGPSLWPPPCAPVSTLLGHNGGSRAAKGQLPKQIAKAASSGLDMIRFCCSCRSTAGGRPRCKGVRYRAWDIEQGVREMLDAPETWGELLGTDAAEETVGRVMATWRIILWTWQNDWLKAAVHRIKIDEGEGEIQDASKAWRIAHPACSAAGGCAGAGRGLE